MLYKNSSLISVFIGTPVLRPVHVKCLSNMLFFVLKCHIMPHKSELLVVSLRCSDTFCTIPPKESPVSNFMM